jgi:tetratricopeptide (TPR) repeat protein
VFWSSSPDLRSWGRVALSCVVAVSLLFLLAPAADAACPCDVADALRSAGLLQEAEAAYERLAASPAPEACAVEGLDALATERARRARLLAHSLESDGVGENTVTALATAVRAGREDEIARTFRSEVRGGQGFAIARALKVSGFPQAAGNVLAEAIAADPSAELPDDLRGLSDAGLHLAAAEALSRAGLDEPAREELELALKEDPTLDVPDELASPNRELPKWRSVLGAAGPWLRTVAEIVIAALAALALALLGFRLVGRFRVRLIIDPFTGGAGDNAGPDMTAAVRENYGRLRDQSGGTALKLVTSSGETSIGLPPEVAKEYPQAALIAALIGFIDRLFPARTRKANGYLRPRDPTRGAGVTVTFARRYGKTFGEITLWESDYGPLAPQGEKDPPQPAYDRVAVPAATWLMYEAGERALRRRLPLDQLPLVRRLPSVWQFQILGARDWRSYALFAVGAEAHARGDEPSARRRYLDALRHEPGNRGAKFNLAVAELEGVGAEGNGPERARSRLEELQRTLEATGEQEQEAMWYRVRYTQAVAGLGREPSEARRAAVDLCATLLDRLGEIDHRRTRRRSTKELRDFLRSVRPRTLVVLASALEEEGRPPRAEPPTATTLLARLKALWEKLVRALQAVLGIELGESVAASAGLAAPVDPNTLAAQLKAFAEKPDDPNVSDEFDLRVTHEAVVAHVITAYGSQEDATAYNLACYYARVRRWSDAEQSLHLAVELGGARLGEQALKDQALNTYLADAKRRSRLKKLIDGLKDPEPTPADDAPSKNAPAKPASA